MITYDLSGKTAVVTGASRGIGKAMAEALETAGAKVVRVSSKDCDMSDRRSVYDFIAKVKAENPVIDILVNNAGTILRAPGRSRAFAPDLGAHPRRTLGGSFGHRRSVRVSLFAGFGLHQRHRSAGGRRLAREIIRPAFA